MNLIQTFLFGLLVFTCCQAIWPLDGFHNVGNKRPLESESEIVAKLANRLTAIEKEFHEARKEAEAAHKEVQAAHKEAQAAHKEAQAAQEDSDKFRVQLAVVEKKLLKVAAANRNFCIFAARFDEDQHREH